MKTDEKFENNENISLNSATPPVVHESLKALHVYDPGV